MKKILMLICTGLCCCMLAGCGDEEVSETTDDYYAEEESANYEADYEDDEISEDTSSELEEEIDKYTEVYAGDYGDELDILIAFDWSEEEHNGLVMITSKSSGEISYFNVGEVSGEIGELQEISGFSEYPFAFTISDYDEDGSFLVLSFDDDGECKVNRKDTGYLREMCESLGML